MIENIANNPILASIALSVLIIALRELWGFTTLTGKREWERIEKALAALSEKTQQHAGSLTTTTARLDNLSKEQGALEQQQQQLIGKVEGLQAFWRVEFDKFRDEIRTGLKDTSREFRDELAAHRESQRGRHEDLLANLRQQNTELLHEFASLIESVRK